METAQSIAIFAAPVITLAGAIFVWVMQTNKATQVKEQMEQKIEATSKLLEQKIDGNSKLLEQKVDASIKFVEEKIASSAALLSKDTVALGSKFDARFDTLEKTLADMRSQQQIILARLPERDVSARA
jgi:CHASE1-domain containing sensor protein